MLATLALTNLVPLLYSLYGHREPPAGRRADLFGLRSVLYTLPTGRPSFWNGGALAALKGVRADRHWPTATSDPKPRAAVRACRRPLVEAAHERCASAQEFADPLGRHLGPPPPPEAPPKAAADF